VRVLQNGYAIQQNGRRQKPDPGKNGSNGNDKEAGRQLVAVLIGARARNAGNAQVKRGERGRTQVRCGRNGKSETIRGAAATQRQARGGSRQETMANGVAGRRQEAGARARARGNAAAVTSNLMLRQQSGKAQARQKPENAAGPRR